MSNKRKTLIVGAGSAGKQLCKYLDRKEKSIEVIGFVDDDVKKKNKIFIGREVLGKTSEIKKLGSKYGVNELYIASPTASGKLIRDIVISTEGMKLRINIVPRTLDFESPRSVILDRKGLLR